MQPFAFAFPSEPFVSAIGQATQLNICLVTIAGDGINPAKQLVDLPYTYDVTLPLATNLANIKAAVAALAASEAGIQVSTDNVMLLLAVN
jgi:hypothetical protein